MSLKSLLNALGDQVRRLSGSTGNKSIEEMTVLLSGVTAGIDTSGANAGSGDIRHGKTAYVDGELIEGVLPDVEAATPSISVSAAGLITATVKQNAGYVASGTKSATRQLTTRAGGTITPGASDVIIPAGSYLLGDIIIKAISGGESGGESGGTTTGAYTGEASASADTELECYKTNTSLGSSAEFKNIVVTLDGNTTDDGVVTQVTSSSGTSGTVYYYDEDSGSIKSVKASISEYRAGTNGYVCGFIVSVNEETSNGSTVRFDGDYTWSFDIAE